MIFQDLKKMPYVLRSVWYLYWPGEIEVGKKKEKKTIPGRESKRRLLNSVWPELRA